MTETSMKILERKGAPARQPLKNVVNANIASRRIVISEDLVNKLKWEKGTELAIGLQLMKVGFRIVLYEGAGPALRRRKGSTSFTLVLPKKALPMIPKEFYTYRYGLKFEIKEALGNPVLSINLGLKAGE